MTESLATVLSHTFEKYVVKGEVEVTKIDPNDSSLSKDQDVCQEEAMSKQPSAMDVDATVQDLLTKCQRKWHRQTTKQHHFSWRFLESVKIKSEETGPPIHEELARIVTCLV